jgi:uncharacterized protein YbjT (DUF2867 family)
VRRLPADVDRAFDIGGPDVLTYRDMMHRYAQIAGLSRRRIIPVPVLSPRSCPASGSARTPVPAAWPAHSWSL